MPGARGQFSVCCGPREDFLSPDCYLHRHSHSITLSYERHPFSLSYLSPPRPLLKTIFDPEFSLPEQLVSRSTVTLHSRKLEFVICLAFGHCGCGSEQATRPYQLLVMACELTKSNSFDQVLRYIILLLGESRCIRQPEPPT